MSTKGPHEHGGAAVELSLLTPLFLALVLLVVLALRVVAAQSGADAAAHAAARAASLERSPQAAHTAAENAAANAMRTHDLACRRHDLDVATDGLRPGAQVRVSVTCHADLADLSGLAVPGTYAAQGQATAVVDTYRENP